MSTSCPICSARERRTVCRASRQPAILNQLYCTREEALRAFAVDLHFVGCLRCGFVWNAEFDSRAIQYEPGYVNDQTCSPAFCEHLEEVIDRLCALTLAGGRDGIVLEIGCGQGDVLKRVCVTTGRPGIGFDPAYSGPARVGDMSFVNQEFTADALATLSNQRVALVFARHVLEHVPGPKAMVKALAQITNARFYFEVPCFDWIASQAAFYDMFHEHCSLFNPRSLATMLNDVVEARDVQISREFDGQYLVAYSHPGNHSQSNDSTIESMPDRWFDEVGSKLDEERSRWRYSMHALLDEGPVLVWGAGAKGISFVNHLGLDHAAIPFIVDVHPRKQSMYVGLTGQQVIAPHTIRDVVDVDRTEPTIIVMNPNYKSEMEGTLHRLGIRAAVLAVNERSLLEVHR